VKPHRHTSLCDCSEHFMLVFTERT